MAKVNPLELCWSPGESERAWGVMAHSGRVPTRTRTHDSEEPLTTAQVSRWLGVSTRTISQPGCVSDPAGGEGRSSVAISIGCGSEVGGVAVAEGVNETDGPLGDSERGDSGVELEQDGAPECESRRLRNRVLPTARAVPRPGRGRT